MSVPYARPTRRKTSGLMSEPTRPRTAYARKMRGLSMGALTGLERRNELRAHIHAALDVGATGEEVAEVIFQQVTYGGMPVVVEALDVYAKVLGERGEPFPAEESSGR